MRRATKLSWVRGLAAVLALAALALSAEILASGRTRPPTDAHAAALAAYEAASGGSGSGWAVAELAAARSALDGALLGYSRQQARPFPLRDFRPVSAALHQSYTLSLEAARQGDQRREAARAEARRALDDARELERHALSLVAVTRLAARERAHLLRARLLLREAELLARDDDPRAAAERARGAARELRSAVGPSLAAAERYRSREQVATWRRWIAETQSASRASGEHAILVLKEKHLLVLLARGVPLRRYDAELGANALGVKARQGDRATPEGRYRIVKKKDRGHSVYHRALLLDYPNAADRARFRAARRRGEVPPGAGIGGLIEIHGEGGRGQNWTDGCIALRNADMDDLFRRVRVGTMVTIVGGDGSDGAFSSLLEHVRPEEGS